MTVCKLHANYDQYSVLANVGVGFRYNPVRSKARIDRLQVHLGVCMFKVLLVCVSILQSDAADEWQPPANPDPRAILQEARRDTENKAYAAALVKHVWYHENAISIEPAQVGVRLSFALSYWLELAEAYPPAKAKLMEIRDKAGKETLEGKDGTDAFHDFVSINRVLGEPELTKKLFVQLDNDKPKQARALFELARPSLIQAKAYVLCAKYVDGEVAYKREVDFYKRLIDNPVGGARMADYARQRFTHESATLVALLFIKGDKESARRIADAARKEIEEESFNELLDAALKGKVPKPM